MATGRIGVTPVLRTRWSKQPTAGTTSLSGLDDNSVSLVYDVGYEAVYRNGVLLSRGNDYTATSGTSITLIDATLTGDIVEVFANDLVPLTDAISKGQFTAKGALLSATAASTPGVITVGANDTVLTADSTASTGLKWAAPVSGGMTLISTTTLTGASVTLSSIPATYNSLFLIISGVTGATSNTFVRILPNNVNNLSDLTIIYNTTLGGRSAAGIQLGTSQEPSRTSANNIYAIEIFNYASTSTFKAFSGTGLYFDVTSANARTAQFGAFRSTTAISSLVLDRDGGGDFSTGTVLLYGVK